LRLAAFDNYRWKLCSVFIIAHYCTIWQLLVFTSRQLHSACSSTQPLILLPCRRLFHTFHLKLTPLHYLSMCDLRVTAHGEEIDDRVGCGWGVRQTLVEACYWLLAKTVATNHSNELVTATVCRTLLISLPKRACKKSINTIATV